MAAKRAYSMDDDRTECMALLQRIDRKYTTALNSFHRQIVDIVSHELLEYVDAIDPEGVTLPIPTEVANMTTDEHDGMDDSVEPPPKRRLREVLAARSLESSSDESIAVRRNDTSTVITAAKSDKLVLCDNAIILFIGQANEQVRKDVTNSLILAQINAEKKVLAFKEKMGSSTSVVLTMEEWMRVFQETFRHMNWADTGFQVASAAAEGTDLTMDKIVLSIIEAIGTDEEKSKMKKALAVLKRIPQEDDRMQLFNRRTSARDFSQFQAHVVYIDQRGSATMKTTMFAVSTKETVTNVLWFQWKDASTRVYSAEHTMMLGSSAFDMMRPIIERKIQQINETYVNQIPF